MKSQMMMNRHCSLFRGSLQIKMGPECALRLVLVVCLVCWACLVANDAWAQDKVAPGEAHPDALTYSQAYGANMDSLRCFDLVLASETVRLDEDQPVVSKFFWRILADYDQMKFLLLRETSRRVVAAGSEEPTLKKAIFGYFVDGKSREVWELGSGGEARQLGFRNVDDENFTYKVLRKSGFSDPRLIGLVPFPATFENKDSMREIVRGTFSNLSDSTFRQVDEDTVAISITKPFTEVSSVRLGYQFDVERLVPTSVKCEDGIRGDFRMTEREALTWEEVNGHFVPVELNGERSIKQLPPRKESISEYYHVALRWQSINQPDELSALKAETLTDIERVVSLLGEVHRFDGSRGVREGAGRGQD